MKILIIINQGTTTQIALRIIKLHTEDFTNKSSNHRKEDKVTLVGSTALTFMSLLNGGIFKSKVRLLHVHFKLSHVYQYYKLYINVTNKLFQTLFCHIKKWTHQRSIISEQDVSPPFLPVNRASAHHCYPADQGQASRLV